MTLLGSNPPLPPKKKICRNYYRKRACQRGKDTNLLNKSSGRSRLGNCRKESQGHYRAVVQDKSKMRTNVKKCPNYLRSLGLMLLKLGHLLLLLLFTWVKTFSVSFGKCFCSFSIFARDCFQCCYAIQCRPFGLMSVSYKYHQHINVFIRQAATRNVTFKVI